MPQLDAMRAAAALFVLLYHCDVTFGSARLVHHAELAVDFFFLLSGFVLNAGVERDCREPRGGMRFAMQRVARLWPMMALGTGLGLLGFVLDQGTLAHVPSLMPLVLLALLFVPRRATQELIFPLNGPQWSLLLELIANATHAVVLSRLPTRLLLLLAGSSWLALLAVGLAKGGIGFGPMSPGWQLGVLRIGFAYTMGCVMARHAQQIAAGPRLPWWASLLALALLLVCPAAPPAFDGALAALLVAAFVPVLALGAAARPPARLHRAMSAAGAASWPLYALHVPLLHMAGVATAKGWASTTVAVPFAATSAVILAFALRSGPLARGLRLSSTTPSLRVHRPRALSLYEGTSAP